jgi:hypothetical protein
MPLILAIEPDRHQATQLSAVVHKRVSAELILVETTEQALDAIGNRMPDLVLVPALLSPQDDAALAGALRVIAAAARVQMLTIPVLGSALPAARSGGMLSVLRRGKSRVVQADGCDPSVFAEQIASYLEHAEQERAGAGGYTVPDVSISSTEATAPVEVEAARDTATEAFLESLDDLIAAPASVTEEFPASVDDGIEVVSEPAIVHASGDALDQRADGDRVESVVGANGETSEPLMMAAADESVSIALEEAVRALFADTTPVVETLTESSAQPPESVDRAALEPPPVNGREAVEELLAALETVPLSLIEVYLIEEPTVPVVESPESLVAKPDEVFEDPNGDRIDIAAASGTADGRPATAAAKSEREWVALIESLRHDVERLRVERAARPLQKPSDKSAQAPARPARAGKPAKPVQDEWGFFDPEQCGFAALLAKLDEVTEIDEGRI